MYLPGTSRKPAFGAGGVKLARNSNDPRVANIRVRNTSGRSSITAPLAAPSRRKQLETQSVAMQPRHQLRNPVIGPEGDEALSEITSRQEVVRFDALASMCNAGKPAEESHAVDATEESQDVDASVSARCLEARLMLSDPDALVNVLRPRPVAADHRVRIAALVKKDQALKSAKAARAGSTAKNINDVGNPQINTLLDYLDNPMRLKVKGLHQGNPTPEELSAAQIRYQQGPLKLDPRGMKDASTATLLLKSCFSMDFHEGEKLIPVWQQRAIAYAQQTWFNHVDSECLPGVLASQMLECMPEPHQFAFEKILKHLARVAENSAVNGMDAGALASIYGEKLIADLKLSPSDYPEKLARARSVMKSMIELHMTGMAETSESQ